MGSMRQLASMIRHVHEAQAIGIGEDLAGEMLAFAPGEDELAHLPVSDEAAREAVVPQN